VATESQPLTPDEPEPIEPEIEAAAVEPVNEPEPIVEATPLPEEQLDSTEEPEPVEPEVEAAVEPAAAEPIPETEDELEWSAEEPESAVEPEEDQTEHTEYAEAESEPPENPHSGAKTLVDSIASIFTRKRAPFAKTSILGLRDTQPSSDEPWEPATPEAGFAAKPAAESEDESLLPAEVVPAHPEPWEPPPLKIEFTAKFATEFAAEPETEETEQPLPTPEPESAEPEPAEPENEPPSEPEADPDDPLWPPRA
jgi:hypothetical protein